jgi:DNA-binding IclR family transcriptional regulator
MNDAELAILRLFRTYAVEAHQMLFVQAGFAKPETAEFNHAMQSMIRRGFVVAERHRGAYSLTMRGYRASLLAL